MKKMLISVAVILGIVINSCNNKNSNKIDLLNGDEAEEYTHSLPENFGPELFIEEEGNEYFGKPVDVKMLKDMGFEFTHKGKTMILAGTAPEIYEKVPTYTYEYKGIEVTIMSSGLGVVIDFPNEDTLNQFTYIINRGYPVTANDENSYFSLPGMASMSVDDSLILHFDFNP